MNTDIVAYYKERAKEYERIYEKPERQEDLSRVANILQRSFDGQQVLEIACGTGYWTERIARTAKSVLATDINEAVIEIASAKSYGHTIVSFQVGDIFKFSVQSFDALFGGFIWSHIRLEELKSFIEKANNLVKPGGKVVFIDNIYSEGSSTPISSRDEHGNTYQVRTLENGNTFSILKNFPTDDFIRQAVNDGGRDISITKLKYYWMVEYSRR